MRNSRIKIAFVIDGINDPYAGTEKQIVSLVRGINSERFEIILCCFHLSRWLREEFQECQKHEVKINSFGNIKTWINFFSFAHFLRKQKIHIVQTFFRDANIIGIIAARLAGVPVIISSRRNLGFWQTVSEKQILRFLKRFVTRFLANSESVKNHVHTNEGVPLERIDVIYNGFDFSKIEKLVGANKQKKKEEHKIEPQAIVGGVVANLRPVKRIDVLLRALPIILKKAPDFILLVVGDGPERESLELFCRESGILNNVRFLGQRSDVLEILRGCDLGILSSSSEGFSNSIIEYLAMGLPVVVTDVGGAGEVVSKENGLFVPPGNSSALAEGVIRMISLIRNSHYNAHDISLNIKRNFDMKVCIEYHEKYYKKLYNKFVYPSGK